MEAKITRARANFQYLVIIFQFQPFDQLLWRKEDISYWNKQGERPAAWKYAFTCKAFCNGRLLNISIHCLKYKYDL